MAEDNISTNYNTAFEEALANQDSGNTSVPIPHYITAADTLSEANNNKSFLDSALDVGEDITKFIGVATISGAAQLYNIPISIGNIFKDDNNKYEEADPDKIITDLDSDLGKFYEEHQQGADLVGFMLSSLIPGTAGVKILNAGQKSLELAMNAGKFGANMSKAVKLLAPNKQAYLDKAISQVATNSGVASFKNREVIKSLAAGFGQNVLDTAAFETAVSATMFNSPVLENQDLGDFVTNIAVGAGLFGTVGTALHAAKINTALNRTADAAAVAARPWQHIPEYAKKSSPDEKLAIDYESLNSIPDVPADVAPSRYSYLTQAAKSKEATLQNRIRTSFGELADGDQLVAEMMYRSLKNQTVHGQQSATIGLKAISRLRDTPEIEANIDKLGKRIDKGDVTPETLEEYLNTTVTPKYIKMWGDNAGQVYESRLRSTSVTDNLKKNQQVVVKKGKVVAGDKTYNFSMVPNVSKTTKIKHFNMMTSSPMEANARYIWAMEGAPALKPSATSPISIHAYDIPMLEKAHKEFANTPEAWDHVSIVGRGKPIKITGAEANEFIYNKKLEVANKLLMKSATVRKNATADSLAKKLTQDEIASMVNIKPKVLNGELEASAVSSYSPSDMYALQSYQEDFTKRLIDSGLRPEKAEKARIWNTPQQLKVIYDTAPYNGVNDNVIENMTTIKSQQKLYKEGLERAAASTLGEDYNKLIDIGSDKVYTGAKPSGAGAGRLAAANGDYGSLASIMEHIGATTTNIINKFKESTRETLDPLLYRLASSQEAAIEWSTLNANLRSYSTHYVLDEAGTSLEPLALFKYKQAAKEAASKGESVPSMPRLDPNSPTKIPINNEETLALVKAHIARNGERNTNLAAIRAAQGVAMNRDSMIFYPIPPNLKDYPFFATVTDESVTSGNATSTLYANSAEELETMIRKVRENPQLTVRTKKDAENYFKSQGKWDYEKTISSNYIDTELKRKGVSAPTLVATDPAKIVEDTLNWHMDRETGLVREAIAAKYEVEFEELRRLGDEYTNVDTSQFSKLSTLEYAEDVVKNPFADYIRTALGIGKQADYPFWKNLNQLSDKAVSRTLREASKLITSSKSQADLDKVNDLLKKAGYRGAAYDADMDIFVNAKAPRDALTRLVRNANSVLATIVLRLDTLNAVNNAVSANVLLGAETKAVIRAISAGDSEAVGALASLTRTNVPGTTESIFTPTKLIANAIRKFGTKSSRDPAMQFYKDNGYITRLTDQYKDSIDNLTYNPATGTSAWESGINKVVSKLRRAGDLGEKITGNKLAEEFNRFVAADVMKQMTDVAVSRGLMTPKEQLAYIRTFVNRTQGNYLASQRPNMFQGPIGQAIGLFQTYQFNLMQQMLRYVGEGKAKDAMTLLALQGTIHGMNGLPAFNAINTHIVGTASGNREHTDFYNSVYGIVGKSAGDWLMYGLASNALSLIDPNLKTNLYTRGDINPRHLTVIPTDPSQVPIIQATARAMANIKDTLSKIANGGDIYNSILQGLEHNGLSRPLAGLAASFEALNNPEQASYSTTTKGNVVSSNDFFSLINLVRIAGGKPMDEAVAIDTMYRNKAYAAKDLEKRNILGEALKSKVIGGKAISDKDIEDFAEAYARAGGRQDYFNRWIMQLYKSANTSQTNAIMRALESPFTKNMQRIMGGEELRDFSNSQAADNMRRNNLFKIPAYK